MTHAKLLAAFGSPLPLYLNTVGYRQSGRVNRTSRFVAAVPAYLVAMNSSGDVPCSTQRSSAFTMSCAASRTGGSCCPTPPKFEAPAENGPAAVYEYEPEEDELLAELLPRYVATQVFRALLENNASFYGSQMSAMDNATRNAGDMIRKQTITYNRTRQAMITKELIEIISGAEAL